MPQRTSIAQGQAANRRWKSAPAPGDGTGSAPSWPAPPCTPPAGPTRLCTESSARPQCLWRAEGSGSPSAERAVSRAGREHLKLGIDSLSFPCQYSIIKTFTRTERRAPLHSDCPCTPPGPPVSRHCFRFAAHPPLRPLSPSIKSWLLLCASKQAAGVSAHSTSSSPQRANISFERVLGCNSANIL